MEENKCKFCKDCEFFEHDGFPYCLMQDLYTEVSPDDEACGSFLSKDS